MESNDIRRAVESIERQQGDIIKLLKRIEAVLIASTGKIPMEGTRGAVLAVDGSQVSTQDMLEFVDLALKFIPKSFTEPTFVWDSSCPNEWNHRYQLPDTRDYRIQPLTYKECIKIQEALLPNRHAWNYVTQERERSGA